MTRRKFAFQNRLATNTGGGILDIPHTAILRYASVEELVAIFKDQWGTSPEAVILPVTNPDGLLFPVNGLSETMSAYATGLSTTLRDFPDIIQRFADLGLDVYLSIDPTLPFLNSDPLQIIDIAGDSSRQLCLGNSRTQDLVGGILGTAIDIAIESTVKTRGKLKGVVLDMVDLWPMGGNDANIELTCFCPSCEAFLENLKPGLVRRFKTAPNPWNLVLQATSSGMGHISAIRKEHGPDDIVGLSKQKGYQKAFEDDSMPFLLDQARGALDYIEARHTQTLFAAKAIFDQALAGLTSPPRKILVCEGEYYSWSSGLQLERLDAKNHYDTDEPIFDELWFDVRSSAMSLEHVDFRAYMCTRTKYFVNAFFKLAAISSNTEARVSTGVGRLSVARLKDLLRERLGKSLACIMTGQTSLGALPDLASTDPKSKRIGFIGVCLTKEIGEKFIEGLRIAPGVSSSGNEDKPDMEALMKMLMAQRSAGDEQ